MTHSFGKPKQNSSTAKWVLKDYYVSFHSVRDAKFEYLKSKNDAWRHISAKFYILVCHATYDSTFLWQCEFPLDNVKLNISSTYMFAIWHLSQELNVCVKLMSRSSIVWLFNFRLLFRIRKIAVYVTLYVAFFGVCPQKGRTFCVIYRKFLAMLQSA